MNQSPTRPEDRFATMVETLRGHPGVTHSLDSPQAKKEFGSSTLKINGKIFAMLVKGRLVVKLPRQRVDALVTSGDGDRFDPGHGRLMKEWLTVRPTSEQDWLSLAREALEFVAPSR